MTFDVTIVGSGPAGLSAALAFGRARKRVLLCDSGPRRNARATHVHNFVTRDGTPPDELRRIARAQLEKYPRVEVRDVAIDALSGTKGNFSALMGSASIVSRRVLLCTGMVDQMRPLEGFRALWGRSIFQCPYCHGWEVQDRPWGYLARPENLSHLLPFVLQLRGWTQEVTVFTNGDFDIEEGIGQQLEAAGVRVETASVVGLVAREGQLEAVALANGTEVRCEALFAHPPQQQTELVRSLGVQLDDDGYVEVDPMTRETSVPGIYAAGDLTTRMQAALAAAASGLQAAAAINAELTMELALARQL